MYQTLNASMHRPKTVLQTRENTSHSLTHTRFNSYRNPQKQTIQEQFTPESQNKFYLDQLNHICLLIPTNKAESQGFQAYQRKSNPYSRQNIHQMNRKYREIRSNRASPVLGLYDMQNDRRMGHLRTISNINDYENLVYNSGQMKPLVQSLKKLSQRKVSSQHGIRKKYTEKLEINRQTDQQQAILKPKSSQRSERKSLKQDSRKELIPKKSVDIFMPEKQSETGYVLHKFESKLKKKSIQDNLHVMATLLKRKIKILDKKDMMSYLRKIMQRNIEQKQQQK